MLTTAYIQREYEGYIKIFENDVPYFGYYVDTQP